MAKSRKTLRQKQIADLHSNQFPTTETPTPSFATYSLPDTKTVISSTKQTKPTKTILDQVTVLNDLRKTLFLTGAIVLAELVLFFVL